MTDMDHIFRKKLYNHESQLPGDMWSKIESDLHKEKPGRGYLWILMAGFALLVCATASFIYLESNSGLELVTAEKNGFPSDNYPPYLTNSTEKTEFRNALKTPNQTRLFIREDEKLSASTNSSLSKLDKLLNQSSLSQLKSSIESIEYKEYTPGVNALGIIVPSKIKIKEDHNKVFPDPVVCYGFSRRKSVPKLFVETHYNTLFAKSLLSSNSTEIGNEYLNLRRNTETALYSWSAGFNIGWISNYNIGLKGGLNYEQINERFDYDDPDAIRNQTIIVIDTVFNTDGTFIINSDTSTIQVNGVEMLQIHNYHRNIEIPLNLLYQIEMGNMAMEISGGPVFNLRYSNRGKIVDPANNDQWFTNGENGAYQVFKDRLSVSFNFSISALYNVNENVQLYARPNFKFHPKTWSNSTSPFNQKYANIGLAAGVRYYFTGNPNF